MFDNGAPMPVVKSNIGFMGIMLDKGTHHIELRYEVQYLGAGLTVSIVFLLLYVGLALYRRYHFLNTGKAGTVSSTTH